MLTQLRNSLFIILSFLTFINAQDKSKNSEITSQEILNHIKFLASDDLKGRFTGAEGCLVASKYIEADLKATGLQPLFGNSFVQEFDFISGIQLGTDNALSINLAGKPNQLELKKDFSVYGFSGSNNVNGALVFVGYGISAPKLKYDDYEGVDVKGKIVVAMRYDPDYNDNHSQYMNYSSARAKATTAKEKGAIGLILVNGFMPKDSEDKLAEARYDRAAGMGDFPVVQIKRSWINDLLAAEGIDFAKIQDEISKSKKPHSILIKSSVVTLATSVSEIKKKGINVGGLLVGNDPKLKDEYVVFGAHFDHLGMGETGSLYRGTEPQIHNGADDNASGTAGVLELAEKFAANKNDLKRSIIFLLFSGEELGLLGSAYFSNNSPIATEKMVSMINLDMVGRLKDSTLIVYGTGTSADYKKILNEKNNQGFKLTFNDEGYGPSDHSSFYAKKIPVLFFFTGTHEDYHRPGDDWEKINSDGEQKVVDYIYNVGSSIVNSATTPNYISIAKKDESRSGGWRVYVGTIPDYSYTGKGLKINGANENSPAKKAGLDAGDIILKFGTKEINNIYDYVDALGIYSPGDKVEIVVDRKGTTFKTTAELGAK